MNRILFIYSLAKLTGLKGKSTKLEEGFRSAGFQIDAVYEIGGTKIVQRIWNLLSLHWTMARSLVFSQHDIYFIRYNYYFLFLFIMAGIARANLQIEMNSRSHSELLAKNQRIRAAVDRISMALALRFARRVHAVSRELEHFLAARSPRANVVFNPNFIVDEYFTPRRYDEMSYHGLINVVFLGNADQTWHGVDVFLRTVVDGNCWFLQNCRMHFVGQASSQIRSLCKEIGIDNLTTFHGFLTGANKHKLMSHMDVGISGFNLGAIGLTETTGIKVGEYLHAGLVVVLGYDDPAIEAAGSVALFLTERDGVRAQEKFNDFLATTRSDPSLREKAHIFAQRHLTVRHYVNKVIA